MQLGEAFGLNVRRIRRLKGLSIEALADAAGVADTYVGQMERGRRNPTLSMVERISAALGVQPLDLLQTPVDD